MMNESIRGVLRSYLLEAESVGVLYAREMNRLGHEIALQSNEPWWCEKSLGLTESNAIAKPPALKTRFKEVSLGKDKDGFYVFTHRARSNSYESPDTIPLDRVKFIASTG
jgi:hypothetical protein